MLFSLDSQGGPNEGIPTIEYMHVLFGCSICNDVYASTCKSIAKLSPHHNCKIQVYSPDRCLPIHHRNRYTFAFANRCHSLTKTCLHNTTGDIHRLDTDRVRLSSEFHFRPSHNIFCPSPRQQPSLSPCHMFRWDTPVECMNWIALTATYESIRCRGSVEFSYMPDMESIVQRQC